MTKLTVSLQPQESGKTFVYNYGNVTITVTLDKSQKASDTYHIILYNEHLMLLAAAGTADSEVSRRGKTIVFVSPAKHIWLPGDYFLLLRDSSGKVLRFDIQLDENATFHCNAPRLCPRMSDEDMLSGPLSEHLSTWRYLSNIPGTMQLRRWAIERSKKNEVNKLRVSHNMENLKLCNNMLLCGVNGHHLGFETSFMLQASDVKTERSYGSCATFYDMTRNNPYEALNEFFSEKPDTSEPDTLHVLFPSFPDMTKRTYVFSEIGALTENGGRQIMKKILANWPDTNKSAIFRGTQQELDSLLEQYPTLGEHFPAENRLKLEPYSCDELIHFMFFVIKTHKLQLMPEATDKLCRVTREAYGRGLITHWNKKHIADYVKKQLTPKHFQNAIERAKTKCLSSNEEVEEGLYVQPSDIDEAYFLNQSNAYNDAIRELQAMVGLTEIKRNILSLSSRTMFLQERRQLGLNCSEGATYHTILTGNPGTGKTTVAKLLGKIYHSLGLLSKGGVVYVDRARIVGKFIGDTEDNMKQILKEAQGNVLFIDEAYTLYSQTSDRDFGRRAVECLLDVLSRKDPDMLIVFAGYEKEMDELMSMNKGLAGRFPYKFRFPDYTADELMQIAEKMLTTDQYELAAEARTLLLKSIREAAGSRSESFGNARWMEQFVHNGIIPALADRVSSLPLASRALSPSLYQRIEAADVRAAAEKFNPKTIGLKRPRAIGFCA